MTEIENTLTDLIHFSSNQKPIEFGNAFNSLIADKVATAIDAKKIEVARAMFNPSLDTDDEDIEHESEEE